MEEQKVKGKKSSHLLVGSIIAVISIISIFAYIGLNVSKDLVYPNVKIEGTDVEYLTKEQLKEKISHKFKGTLGSENIEVFFEEKTWNYSYENFDARYDIDKAVQEAYDLGKEGNIFNKAQAYFNLKKNGKDIPIPIKINNSKTKEIVEQLAEKIHREPVDATIAYDKGHFKITPEKNGIDLQEERAEKLIKDGIQQKKSEEIELPVDITPPKITEVLLKNIKEKVAGFSTQFSLSAVGRTSNLKLAANKVNGIVLLPGEIFSTYEVIGPITKANGYKDASVIVDGQLEPGVGGGVCQIATTIYNAAVRSDLEIIERRHHSFPASYVPIGQDATIAGTWSDMKFKNNIKNPIYIQMYISGNKLVANIYGNKEGSNREIKLQTDILSEIQPKISYKKDSSKYTDYKKQEKASKVGYKANVYKIIYENGKQVKKELLHYDHYRPIDGVVVIGTKEKVTTNPKTPETTSETEDQDSKPDSVVPESTE